jgi:hypothetical protein
MLLLVVAYHPMVNAATSVLAVALSTALPLATL